MVVTRDAFRTLGAADDPDSTVPCQLPVRVCELCRRRGCPQNEGLDHSLLCFDRSFVSEQELFSVQEASKREPGRGSVNHQCNICIEYKAMSTHRDPQSPVHVSM